MTHTSTRHDHQEPGLLSRRAGLVRTLGLSVVGPVAVFYLCQNAGMPEVWALVVAGSLPALNVLLGWMRWRTLDVIGAVALGTVAMSIAVAFVTADARVVLLLQGAAMFAVFGLAMFVSLLWRRPLMFYLNQAFYGGRHSVDGAEPEKEYDRYEVARSAWRTLTTVWAVTSLVMAGGLVLVVQMASTATALVVNTTGPLLVYGALGAWGFWWQGRLRRQGSDEAVLALERPDTQNGAAQPDASGAPKGAG